MPMAIKKLLEHNAFYIAIFLTLLIAFLSLISLRGIHVINVRNSDKFGHFFAYLCLTLSWLYASKAPPLKKVKKYIIILLIISYGIVIELLQGAITTSRQADFYDFIANTVGVLLATVIFKKINRMFLEK